MDKQLEATVKSVEPPFSMYRDMRHHNHRCRNERAVEQLLSLLHQEDPKRLVTLGVEVGYTIRYEDITNTLLDDLQITHTLYNERNPTSSIPTSRLERFFRKRVLRRGYRDDDFLEGNTSVKHQLRAVRNWLLEFPNKGY